MKYIPLLLAITLCASLPAFANTLPGTAKQDIGPQLNRYKASGPITARSGQTIAGLHITNPNGPCIRIVDANIVRIVNNKIGPCGKTAQGVGIDLYNSTNIKIDHNSFYDVASGLSAVSSPKGNIVFTKNYANYVRGPMPRGQMVQFDSVQGPGNKITCNVSDQALGGYGSGPEDHVNLFKSSGTKTSPIIVSHNKIRGGATETGSGIVTGDYGGAYETVSNNILVNPGQVGIGVAGGHDIKILSNKIYSAKRAANNVGMCAWGQANAACSNIEMRGNRLSFRRASGEFVDYWNGGNCGNDPTIVRAEKYNSFADKKLTAAIWNTVIPECK